LTNLQEELSLTPDSLIKTSFTGNIVELDLLRPVYFKKNAYLIKDDFEIQFLFFEGKKT
jgi:hypothetical protein